MPTRNNIEQIQEKLRFYFDKGRNVLLEGRKGVGKTTLIQQVFDEKCPGKWLYFSGSTLDPWVDFIGVPKETKEGKKVFLDFVVPKYMLDTSIEAIFIDEYSRAPKAVRNAVLELIQFKSINGRKFSNLKTVWAGINPTEDGDEVYDVEELDPAQRDRFHIHITVPYQLNYEYFKGKYGEENAKVAVEWWQELDEASLSEVSPRRLDYGLEILEEGGYLEDVFPPSINSSELVAKLKFGNVKDKLKDIFKDRDYKRGEEFLTNDNEYHAAMPHIKANAEWFTFFMPLIGKERLTSLFIGDTDVRKNVFSNAIYFKDFLVEISSPSNHDLLDPNILRECNQRLKQVEGVVYFKPND